MTSANTKKLRTAWVPIDNEFGDNDRGDSFPGKKGVPEKRI